MRVPVEMCRIQPFVSFGSVEHSGPLGSLSISTRIRVHCESRVATMQAHMPS